MFHSEEKRPKVGVAVIVKKEEKILIGKRIGAHGSSTWSFPGGHLEWTESWEDCAIREVREEAGTEINDVRFLYATNDVMYADGKHYVTIFMVADLISGEPRVCEPDKCLGWEWAEWDDMPEPRFLPIDNLLDAGISPYPQVLTPEQQQVVNKTKEYVRARLEGDTGGHDWLHCYRVWKTAKTIAKQETCDHFIVELAALLHDISDYKSNGGDTEAGPRIAKEWLDACHVDAKTGDSVADIIRTISFKGARVDDTMRSIEGKIVQDSDRLDAMGAIGIGRAFAYGGSIGRAMHDPNIEPVLHDSFDAFAKKSGTAINHFYEKLLLLKDRMKTETGKRLAQERHIFMEKFLEQFYVEWEGGANESKVITVEDEIKSEPALNVGTSEKITSKLVRDRIPEIIRRTGEEPVVRVATDDEHKISLKDKLLEEVREFCEAENIEELADILEVIDGICLAHGFSREEIEKTKNIKRSERGGFEGKVILEL